MTYRLRFLLWGRAKSRLGVLELYLRTVRKPRKDKGTNLWVSGTDTLCSSSSHQPPTDGSRQLGERPQEALPMVRIMQSPLEILPG